MGIRAGALVACLVAEVTTSPGKWRVESSEWRGLRIRLHGRSKPDRDVGEICGSAYGRRKYRFEKLFGNADSPARHSGRRLTVRPRASCSGPTGGSKKGREAVIREVGGRRCLAKQLLSTSLPFRPVVRSVDDSALDSFLRIEPRRSQLLTSSVQNSDTHTLAYANSLVQSIAATAGPGVDDDLGTFPILPFHFKESYTIMRGRFVPYLYISFSRRHDYRDPGRSHVERADARPR